MDPETEQGAVRVASFLVLLAMVMLILHLLGRVDPKDRARCEQACAPSPAHYTLSGCLCERSTGFFQEKPL
jgi:hypothetical protein